MKTSYSILIAIPLATFLAACSTMEATQPQAAPVAAVEGEQVQEIMPGMLQGYLAKEDMLDSKEFVLPAPGENSALQTLDTTWAEKMLFETD